MAGPKTGAWSVVVSLLVAAAMATIALITVQQAGCDDPGRYVARAGGWDLVGGCIEPGDLPVTTGTTPERPIPSPDERSPLRP